MSCSWPPSPNTDRLDHNLCEKFTCQVSHVSDKPMPRKRKRLLTTRTSWTILSFHIERSRIKSIPIEVRFCAYLLEITLVIHVINFIMFRLRFLHWQKNPAPLYKISHRFNIFFLHLLVFGQLVGVGEFSAATIADGFPCLRMQPPLGMCWQYGSPSALISNPSYFICKHLLKQPQQLWSFSVVTYSHGFTESNASLSFKKLGENSYNLQAGINCNTHNSMYVRKAEQTLLLVKLFSSAIKKSCHINMFKEIICRTI